MGFWGDEYVEPIAAWYPGTWTPDTIYGWALGTQMPWATKDWGKTPSFVLAYEPVWAQGIGSMNRGMTFSDFSPVENLPNWYGGFDSYRQTDSFGCRIDDSTYLDYIGKNIDIIWILDDLIDAYDL